jgi:hypothetical protein
MSELTSAMTPVRAPRGWHANADGRRAAGYNRAMQGRGVHRTKGITAVVATVALVACGAQGGATEGARGIERSGLAAQVEGARSVVATTPNGTTLVLEVARTNAERARGLMQRAEVPPGSGMIFFFDRPARHSFWMYNCLVALDLVWLDAQGTVIDVKVAVPPCPTEPCESYMPSAAASMVIEVAAHEAARLGLVPGARVLIAPAPGAGVP